MTRKELNRILAKVGLMVREDGSIFVPVSHPELSKLLKEETPRSYAKLLRSSSALLDPATVAVIDGKHYRGFTLDADTALRVAKQVGPTTVTTKAPATNQEKADQLLESILAATLHTGAQVSELIEEYELGGDKASQANMVLAAYGLRCFPDGALFIATANLLSPLLPEWDGQDVVKVLRNGSHVLERTATKYINPKPCSGILVSTSR